MAQRRFNLSLVFKRERWSGNCATVRYHQAAATPAFFGRFRVSTNHGRRKKQTGHYDNGQIWISFVWTLYQPFWRRVSSHLCVLRLERMRSNEARRRFRLRQNNCCQTRPWAERRSQESCCPEI